MIGVDEVYNFVSFVVNKNLNGAFTPKGFNQAIKAANISLFDELRGGRFSTYQSGVGNGFSSIRPERGVPTIGMEESKTLSEELDPFIKTGSVSVVGGLAAIPVDMVQSLGILVSGTNIPLDWVKKSDIGDYLISDIDFPDADVNPIYTNVGGSWEVYPATIASIKVYYLRMPATPLYDYTISGSTITFNTGTSVNFEWKPTAFLALASKVLSYLGVNLSNQEILTYAERMKMEEK